MGQNIQLKTGLVAEPLGQTQPVHSHVVGSALGARATAVKPIDLNTKLLKAFDQPIRTQRRRCRGNRQNKGDEESSEERHTATHGTRPIGRNASLPGTEPWQASSETSEPSENQARKIDFLHIQG